MFELIIQSKKPDKDEPQVALGLRLAIAGHETLCPVSGWCEDFKHFDREMQAILAQLGGIRSKAEKLFETASAQGRLGLRLDMAPPEIWTILSGIREESEFARSFNSLDEATRRGVAEHVLTKCNVFSGKAAVFSARYNDGTALMN